MRARNARQDTRRQRRAAAPTVPPPSIADILAAPHRSIAEEARLHAISASMVKKLIALGAPVQRRGRVERIRLPTIKVGKRRLIAREASERFWAELAAAQQAA